MSGKSPPLSPLLPNSDLPHKEYPGECAWSDYCNNFEKSESEYFLSNPNIYSI